MPGRRRRAGAQLLPHDRRRDVADPRRRVEPAVGAGDDPPRIADRAGDGREPIGDHLRVLDEVVGGVDDAGDEHHAVGQRTTLEAVVLVGVAGVGHRQHERADVGLVEERLDVGERDVVGVRALVVPPADVQPDVGGVDAVERGVDGVDHELDPVEELAERPVGEEGVALHGEVGRVDLQQQSALDDGAVLGAERGRHGSHVLGS